MRKYLITAVIVGFVLTAYPAYAQTPTIEDLQEQIAELQELLASLQEQVAEISGTIEDDAEDDDETETEDEEDDTDSSESETRVRIRIDQRLERGDSGEHVRILQKFLSTDPTLYPEGLVTGFFGPLTEAAVKRFQAKLELEQVGEVGPKTRAFLNDIFARTGISADVIPDDLLRTRVKVEIREEDGERRVKIEIKPDNSGPGSVNSGRDDDDDEEDEDDDDDEDESDDDESDDDEAEDSSSDVSGASA